MAVALRSASTAEEGHLLGPTVGVVYGACGLHLLASLLGVRWREPQESWLLLTGLGWTAAGLGTALFVSGWCTPVTDDSTLTTSGPNSGSIYRLSRNPQNVGWAITLLGLSLKRRSWAGTGLTGLFWAAFTINLPTEGAFLGETRRKAYRRYKTRTPHFLGWRPS